MKIIARIALALAAAVGLIHGQVNPMRQAHVSTAASTPIPNFVAYRHFLAWANDLNEKAIAANESDPYKFAAPFRWAGLGSVELDALLREAKALDADLKAHDDQLRDAVTRYRRTAQTAAAAGLPLPPLPSEFHDLDALWTAITIQHMVHLRLALGSEKSAGLDAYLSHEFVPHIGLKMLVHPVTGKATAVSSQPFGLGNR